MYNDYLTRLSAFAHSFTVAAAAKLGDRRDNDHGEGVISTAIVVMIVAFLAALMWVAFKRIWGNAETNIDTSITSVGK